MSAQPHPTRSSQGRSPGEVLRDLYAATGTTPAQIALEAARRAGHPVAGSFGQPEVSPRWADAIEAEQQLAETQRQTRTEIAQAEALGRIVHVLVHPTLNNGSDVAPAVITRVWGQAHDGTQLVNLRVWLDGTNHSHEWATSRHLHADEASARKAHGDQLALLVGFDDEHPIGVSAHAFWPARA